jgi:putative membrane protein
VVARILRIALYAAAIYAAVWVVDGLEFDGTWITLAVLALVMALVNAVVKPVVKLLALPVVLLTLGLFLLVVNAAMLALVVFVSGQLDLGLTSTGFGATFLGAVVVSVVVWLGELLVKD